MKILRCHGEKIRILLLGFLVLAARIPAALGQDSEPAGSRSEENQGEAAPQAAERPPPAAETTEAKPTETPPRRTIEEIIVTAQKTEESLRDVPISMSVLDSAFLAQQGITDLRGVSLHIPNVQVDLNGFFIQPRIRGFSTEPLNRGFEQAVGLVIDGVPYSRTDYFQAGLFDLDRVEVLRGPQGTLFGKNSTVGTFNMVTKNPTDELTGFIDAQAGELDRRRLEAGIGGPIVPGVLNFRVAGLSDEIDGYVDNTTAAIAPGVSELLGGRDRKAARVKLQFPDLLGGDLLVSYERIELDAEGAPSEVRLLPEGMRPFYRQFDPDADFEPDDFTGSKDFPESSDVQIDTLVAQAHYPLGSWSLDAIAGWSFLQANNTVDLDNVPVEILLAYILEDSPQTTVELRVTSPALPGFFGLDRLFGFPLGETDFIAGFFFQRQELDPIEENVFINVGNLGAQLACEAVALQGGTCADPPGPPPDTGQTVEMSFLTVEQKTDQFAGFGQMNWHFTDRWKALYGMRLNYERKDGHFIGVTEPDTAVLIPSQFPEFDIRKNRSEVNFAPKIGSTYDLTDDVNLFVTWATSFRGGGYDTTNPRPDENEFEKESARSWEAGSKMAFLGGAAHLDLGLYWLDVEDFQAITFAPESVVQNPQVENAAEVRARGIEADLTWLATEWLTLRSSLGFNDTEFIDFPISTCEKGNEDADGDGDPRCDVSGDPLDRAPKWDITVTPMIDYPLAWLPGFRTTSFSSGINLAAGLTVEYQDTQFLRNSLDPRTRQESFIRLNGNIGFANPDQGWSVAFVVENMTDEATSSLVQPVFQTTGGFVQYLEPPRLVFGRFRWEF